MKKKLSLLGMMVLLFVIVIGAQCYNAYITKGEVAGEKPKNAVEDWVEPDKEYLEFYGLDEFVTSLPIIHINTNGQRIEKDTKIWSTIAVKETPEGELSSVMDKPDYEGNITINYRGASSFSQFDKKQYRIKFYKNEGSSNAVGYNFLGMGKNSEWVLNGPFLDKTLIRNRLVYGLAREIMEWAPDTRYVEVFIDGEYQGVYLAVESVNNGESRLRLCEFSLLSGETAYIVKRDRIGTEENPLPVYGYYMGKTFNSLYVSYPSDSKITEAQREWIINDVDIIERVLYSGYFDDPDIGYANYIDVDNFVDYFILNEVVMNNDAGNLSTYLYKELGGKLQIAVWDFNNCYDNYQWFAQDYEEFFLQDNSYFSRLLEDRAFVNKVVNRYRELRQTVLSDENIYGQIDAYVEELGDAVDRNYAIWGYTFNYDYLAVENEFHYSPTDYEDAIAQLKGSINKRFEFLDSHIEDLYVGCIN